MCLIVDANCTSYIVGGSAEAAPIIKWLGKKPAQIAVGGTKLIGEYTKVKRFVDFLATLDRVGRIRRYENAMVDEEAMHLKAKQALKSNDEHIVALAKVSGSRLLFSEDQNLHMDFGNTLLLKPKGKVYQNASHTHLLGRGPLCS